MINHNLNIDGLSDEQAAQAIMELKAAVIELGFTPYDTQAGVLTLGGSGYGAAVGKVAMARV